MMHWIASVLEPVRAIDPRWALAALAFQLCNLVCRSVAWRNVLAAAYPGERLPVWRVGLAYAVGVALNGYLPARGGEAAKVALVRAQLPTSNVVTLASSCSVVILFDSLVGMGLLGTAWATGALPAPPGAPAALGFITGHPVLSVAGGLLFAAGVRSLSHHVTGRLRAGWTHLCQGMRVLRSPGRYARTVVAVQALAWTCRIAVVFCLLHAFGIPAAPHTAALVVVVGGMSTMVPVPGGAGTQQVLAVYALAAVTTTAHALSFSIGMQVGVTAVNTTIGLVAAMLVFGRLHPLAALRHALEMARMPRAAVEPGV